MSISAQVVKELREKTGAGMMDCKKALSENNGDLEKSVDWLRTKGLAAAAKGGAVDAGDDPTVDELEGGEDGVHTRGHHDGVFLAL